MKQILLFATILLMLSGCAAGLVYDRDSRPDDCRPSPDDKQGQRCLDAAVPADVYLLTMAQYP